MKIFKLSALEKNSYNVLLQTFFYLTLLFTGVLDATEVVIIYVAETVIIGFYQIIKLVVSSIKKKRYFMGIYAVLFFIFHYFFFVFIQITFLFVILSINDDRISSSITFKNIDAVLQMKGVVIALIMMFFSYAFRFWEYFYKPKQYNNYGIESFLLQPYVRIFTQQFTAILPAIFILFYDGGIAAAALLIILRGVFDFYIDTLKNNPIYFNKIVGLLSKNNPKDKIKEEKELSDFLTLLIEQ